MTSDGFVSCQDAMVEAEATNAAQMQRVSSVPGSLEAGQTSLPPAAPALFATPLEAPAAAALSDAASATSAASAAAATSAAFAPALLAPYNGPTSMALQGMAGGQLQLLPLSMPMAWPVAAGTAAGTVGYAPPPPPQNELRTIFLVGFPSDVKIRELHNLLKFVPGYEACQFHNTYPSPTGFALFQSRAQALEAISLLNGGEFDNGVFLRAEPARKNLFLKPNDPTIRCVARSARPELLIPATSTPAPLTPETTLLRGLTASPATLGGGMAGPAGDQRWSSAALTGAEGGAGQAGGTWLSLGFAPVTNVNDNQPCNTLFIGNLCNEIDERDLRAVMEPQPGFKHLQLNDTSKGKVCFVEFNDVASAAYVHQTLQGVQVPSNGRGGLRIQFSRNPFGQRRSMPSQQGRGAGGDDAHNSGGGGGFMNGAGAGTISAGISLIPGALDHGHHASDNHQAGMGQQLLTTTGVPLMPPGGAGTTVVPAGMVSLGFKSFAGPPVREVTAVQGGLFGEGVTFLSTGSMPPHSAAAMAAAAPQALAATVAGVTQGMAATSLFGQQVNTFGGFF